MDRRVVVTGIGVIAPIGIGRREFAAALRAGKSGIKAITNFDTAGLDSRIAGQVDDFRPEAFLERKEIRRMARFVQMAVAAAKMAVEDADLPVAPSEALNEYGVIMGTGMGSLERTEQECQTLFSQGAARISPLFLPSSIPNIAAAQIAITYGFRGYLGTTLTACAAGLQAIGEAGYAIQRGDAQVMLAGGSEANVTPLYMASFGRMGALSTRNTEPAAACRPFDRDRDGFVMAEGAGVVVLERLEHAVARDARIYAEIAGFGVSSDAYHVTSPDPGAAGMRLAMERALRKAALDPAQVDYINAHGSGTRLNDALESLAIKKAFGERAYSVPVSSTKSMIGHCLAAAGALELIATLLAMDGGFIPPTINYHTPDPECDLDYVPNEARTGSITTALANSFGFGGQNASLIVRRL